MRRMYAYIDGIGPVNASEGIIARLKRHGEGRPPRIDSRVADDLVMERGDGAADSWGFKGRTDEDLGRFHPGVREQVREYNRKWGRGAYQADCAALDSGDLSAALGDLLNYIDGFLGVKPTHVGYHSALDVEMSYKALNLRKQIESRHRYCDIFSASVPETKRDLVRLISRLAAKELGVSEPQVRWYRELGPSESAPEGMLAFEGRESLNGLVEGPTITDEIWLKHDERPHFALMLTVAHEMKHLSNNERRGRAKLTPGEREQDEADASGFARAFVAALVERCGLKSARGVTGREDVFVNDDEGINLNDSRVNSRFLFPAPRGSLLLDFRTRTTWRRVRGGWEKIHEWIANPQ